MAPTGSFVILIILLVIGALAVCGAFALIAGIIALVRIKRSGGRLRGKGFAVAAMVIGSLLLLALPVAGVAGVLGLGLYQGDSARTNHMKARDQMRADIERRMNEDMHDRIRIMHDRKLPAPKVIFESEPAEPAGRSR